MSSPHVALNGTYSEDPNSDQKTVNNLIFTVFSDFPFRCQFLCEAEISGRKKCSKSGVFDGSDVFDVFDLCLRDRSVEWFWF